MQAEFSRTRLISGVEMGIKRINDKHGRAGLTTGDKMQLAELQKYREFLYECTAPSVIVTDLDFAILRHNGYVLNGNSVGEEKPAKSLHDG